MSFDSVFHGAPNSSSQSNPSGIVSLGIDVSSGQIYYRSPNSVGWQPNTAGNGSGAVLLNPVGSQTILGAFSLSLSDAGSSFVNAGIAQFGPGPYVTGSEFNGTPTVQIQAGSGLNPLEIHAANAVGIDMYAHAAQGFRAPTITMLKSRGTQAAPTAMQSGDNEGAISFGGFDGVAYAVGAQINTATSEIWSNVAHGSLIVFNTINAGSVSLQERLRIQNSAVQMPAGVVMGWYNAAAGTPETGFSRLAAASVALGNGTASDTSGKLTLGNEVLTAAAPVVAASQVGFGSTTAATASAGGGQTGPATVAGYLIINVAGTTQKVPFYNV